MFDLQIPFFVPLWRRIVLVGLLLGWTTVEVLTGAFAWAILFGSIGVYAIYQFFVVWDPKLDED